MSLLFRRLRASLWLLVFFQIVLRPIFAQEAATVISGVPAYKITEEGLTRNVEKVEREKGVSFRCVISKIGEHYYWASRDNVLMVKVESGAFTTFVAASGSGYVRVIADGKKRDASQLGGASDSFDYVEHLLVGLSSITYYGVREK